MRLPLLGTSLPVTRACTLRPRRLNSQFISPVGWKPLADTLVLGVMVGELVSIVAAKWRDWSPLEPQVYRCARRPIDAYARVA
jgi:hypothetical protein